MRRDDICIYVSPSNRARLEALITDRNTPSKVVWRAKIVLATADGHGTNEIRRRTGRPKRCVWRWQERYIDAGVEGLVRDKTRPSRKPPLPDAVKLAVLTKTANATPVNATHWSRAAMAGEMGISPSSVGRIWAAAGLKPHLVAKFKVSNDPQFAKKVTEVVGLYLNPPDRTLVLCVDEKSQIQALDRTAPILPLRPGLPERQTHDYKRHGTTTLFAAFNILNGKVIGTCQDRHRSREFVKFLNHLEKEVPPDQEIHPIMDNSSTHKSAAVQRWLKPRKRRRFHFHFTPTSSSWLNQVERWFGFITGRMIRRGTFHCVELER